jgi:hypothetical protein
MLLPLWNGAVWKEWPKTDNWGNMLISKIGFFIMHFYFKKFPFLVYRLQE